MVSIKFYFLDEKYMSPSFFTYIAIIQSNNISKILQNLHVIGCAPQVVYYIFILV